MSVDGRRSPVDTVRVRWVALERDWQSVVVGATIVALVSAFDLQIPWVL